MTHELIEVSAMPDENHMVRPPTESGNMTDEEKGEFECESGNIAL